MNALASADLAVIARTAELHVSSQRPDGTARPGIPVWMAVVGEQLYVRSAHGPENGWYRRARRSGVGRVTAGSVDVDVAFTHISPDELGLHEQIDAALHAKYDRYGRQYVAPITGAHAHGVTLRIDPR